MKTTKRSKMLISSIAMLLVALVALGSATYAWYTIQRDVSANNMIMKATTPGGLVIAKTEADLANKANSIDFTSETSKTFAPSTLTFSTAGAVSNVLVADAAAAGNKAADTHGTHAPADAATNYYVVGDIWLQNQAAQAGDITGTVSVSAENSAIDNTYMMLKVVQVNATTPTVQSYASSDGANFTNITVNLGSQEKAHYVFVVYCNGEDDNCTTSNATTAAGSSTVAASNVTYGISFHMDDAS